MFDIQARHASLVGVLRQIAAGTVSDPQSWAQRIVAGIDAETESHCDCVWARELEAQVAELRKALVAIDRHTDGSHGRREHFAANGIAREALARYPEEET